MLFLPGLWWTLSGDRLAAHFADKGLEAAALFSITKL